MTPDRWRHITEIFHAALTRPAKERHAFLGEACGDDVTLRREVESLLSGHEQAASFGETPVSVPEGRLTPGATLGSYRVERLIDAGGMGEVYRATDTKLGREVALKVLPAIVAAHPDRLARFTREAQLLAALNHPHIASIYGVEDTGEVYALVLELVEGQTLAKRLSRSKLTVVAALRIAQQMADALAFAHARGVVHRDLKPANVMLTSGDGVKVLDFGLAKASAGMLLQPQVTSSAIGTSEGTVVGTPAYMSPEQARGKPVDKQTDIWAFGCVLFEMLSGARAFPGDTSSDTIAAVLDREPDWKLLPANIPAPINTLLRRCLKKESAERLHDMADASLEIADALSSRPESAATAAAPSRRAWMAAGVVAVVALALVGLILPKREQPADPSGFLELSINLTDVWPGYGFEISPDGRRIAIGVLSAGRAHIWIQALDGSESRSLGPADIGVAPFWSPDSRSIAYVSGGKLWRVVLSGGPPVAICDAAGRGSGSWNADGMIIFSAVGELFRVPASGGSPQPINVADRSPKSALRVSPQFLPDNRTFIYHVTSPTEVAMYLGSLDSSGTRHLLDSPFPAQYVAPGYLLFLRGTALMAQGFDARAQSLTGEAFVVAQDVAPGYVTNMAQFSASPSGVLAFVPTRGGTVGELTWFDRNGKPTGHISAPPRVEYLNPAISPTGDRVAVNRMDPETGDWDVWTIALPENLPTRLTSQPAADLDPVWAPDGKSIVFSSNRDKTPSFYLKSLDSAAAEERLIAFDASVFSAKPTDWTRDGRFIIYDQVDQQRRRGEIWALPLSGDRTPVSLVRDGFANYGPRVSPDGKWLAYNSYEDGAFATYVQRFGGGQRTRVTGSGGIHPRWTNDGKTLVYWAEPGGLSAVDLIFGPSGVRGANPRPMVTERITALLDGRTHYDATRDGQRFLLRQSVGNSRPTVKVLVNWTEKLRP